MTFAAPLFLLGVLAAAIPVLLHMIHRQKALEVRFSTLRFLRVSVQRTRRRKYIDDLSLLLVRVAALGLLAVGLSKPAITTLKALWGHGANTAVAIVLDNSASMATMDNGKPRFETAKHAVEQILDVLHDGDSVAIFFTGGPPTPEQAKLFRTQETLRQTLPQWQLSYERADLAARLQQARSLLAEADNPSKEIYVITDNQTLSWEGLKPNQNESPKSPDVPVVLINVNHDPAPNVALQNIRLECPAPIAGVPILAEVEVRNTSGVLQQVDLELHVDGVKQAVSPTLSIPAGSTTKHEFHFVLDQGGVHRGEVRLAEDDGNPLDNQAFFALAVDQQIPVAIVKARRQDIPFVEETFYLERALATGGAFRTTSLTPEELASEPLSAYAVVFCVNLPAPDSPAADRLRDYAMGGGHLFWICGPDVQPDAYNRMNERLENKLLPAPLAELHDMTAAKGESRHIEYLDADYPALAPLTEPASLFKSVLVYKYFGIAWPEASEGRILARLDDGQPLLVERAVGAGSVLLLGTEAHVDWTNFPLKPLFLPFFSRLTVHLAGASVDHSQVLAGAPLVMPLGGPSDPPPEIEVVRPSGDILRVRSEEASAASFRYTDTHEAGVYLLRLANAKDPKQFAFAVNIDPDEADPASLTAEELKTRFGKYPFVFCDNPEDLAGTIRGLREGQSLWEWFLAAVLVGLVLETALANRHKKLGEVETVQPSSPKDRVAVHGKEEAVPSMTAGKR